MMWCFCPQELCSRKHRTKSPSRILPDLLEKGGTHARQPSSSSGFLPHLALWRGTGAEAMARRGAAASLPRPSFPQSHSCSELGVPLYPLEGTMSTRTTAILFYLGWLPSQTHFTFTPRNHRKRNTCTRKLALPHRFSQADQWPVPYLAGLQVWWLTQPGTVSVLCCSYLEWLTCVLTAYWSLQPPVQLPACLPSNLPGLPTHLHLINSSTYIYYLLISTYQFISLSTYLVAYIFNV